MIKLVFCALIIAWFCNCVYINGFDNYYSCMDYNYHNYFYGFDNRCRSSAGRSDFLYLKGIYCLI